MAISMRALIRALDAKGYDVSMEMSDNGDGGHHLVTKSTWGDQRYPPEDQRKSETIGFVSGRMLKRIRSISYTPLEAAKAFVAVATGDEGHFSGLTGNPAAPKMEQVGVGPDGRPLYAEVGAKVAIPEPVAETPKLTAGANLTPMEEEAEEDLDADQEKGSVSNDLPIDIGESLAPINQAVIEAQERLAAGAEVAGEQKLNVVDMSDFTGDEEAVDEPPKGTK